MFDKSINEKSNSYNPHLSGPGGISGVSGLISLTSPLNIDTKSLSNDDPFKQSNSQKSSSVSNKNVLIILKKGI